MAALIDPNDVAFVIVDTARLLRAEFERQVSQTGMSVTPGEARLLIHLVRTGPIRQNLMAARLGITKMSLTNYVDRLEAHGYVKRADDPTDRRAKIVSMTKAAEPLLAEIAVIAKGVRKAARGSIGDDRWQCFSEIAGKVRANLVSARSSPESRRN